MRTFVAVVLGICFTSAFGCDRAKKELDRLQGEWEVVRIEVGGKEIPLEKVLDKQYTVKEDQLIPSKNPNDPGTLELRPEKKPGWLDITDLAKKTMPGIYRLDGDRWEICSGETGGTRPTDFKTSAESKTYLMVLQRKKK